MTGNFNDKTMSYIIEIFIKNLHERQEILDQT